MRRNPVQFIASGRLPMITRRKVTSMDRRYPAGRTFHDTWEEAQAVLVARLEHEVVQAKRGLKVARSSVKSAEGALAKTRSLTPGEPER